MSGEKGGGAFGGDPRTRVSREEYPDDLLSNVEILGRREGGAGQKGPGLQHNPDIPNEMLCWLI